MQKIIRKNNERISYAFLIISLRILFLFVLLLTYFSFLIPRPKRKKDLLMYPYSFIGSDGYIRRFVEYFKFMKQDNISFDMCNLGYDDELKEIMNGSNIMRYVFYIKIFIKRIFQVLKARNYNAVFIQRGLFPMYYDLKYPYLEMLLRKLNNNITLDYWDAVFDNQPELVNNTIKYVDKLTLSNQFLYDYFVNFKGKKYIYKIAINLNKYIPKTDYSIKGKVKLIWTGLPNNFKNIETYEKLLIDISKEFDLKIILICANNYSIPGVEVSHHYWNEDSFFWLLNSVDIGIYPEVEGIHSKGKSTMKVMDYMSTGLPCLVVPYGIPSEVVDGKEVYIAEGYEEWKNKLRLLIYNKSVRENLGKAGREFVEQNYSIEKSYKIFKSIIFDN